jgi:hypothetical protein
VSLGEPGVGDDEAGLGHLLVAVDEQVQVDRPGAVARPGALPAQCGLDGQQTLEELPRRKLCLDGRGTVQEPGLIEIADRIGLPQSRDPDHLDALLLVEQLEGAANCLRAVAEIGAEADVGAHSAILGRVRPRGALIAVALLGPVFAAGAPPAAAAGELRARTAEPTRAFQAFGGQPYAVVELDRGRAGAEVTLALAGGKPVSRRFGVWRLRTPAARRILPALRRAGLLRASEPDRPVRTFNHITSGDPLLPYQWWVQAIGADRVEPPGPGKPVTVIDSGLDQTHQEFATRPDTQALNPQVLAANDGHPHGTAVGSVVGAYANGVGVVGVYPLASLRFWDADGAGQLTTSGVVAGLDAAIRRGPSVISLSLGVSSSQILEDLVNTAFRSGSLVVAASLPHVLTVAGTEQTGRFAGFSSRSPANDLAAPATDIPVAVPAGDDATGYVLFDGTSFSTPLVSGATAWVWTVRPTLDNTQVFELMRSSARDIAPPGRDEDTGYGLLDIPAALASAPPAPDPQEPNDDIDHVRAHGLFRQASLGLTGPRRSRAELGARLDSTEDPEDVYRIWVPGRRTVVATLRPNGDAQLALWGPRTKTVFERGAALSRDLIATSRRRGSAREVVRVQNKARRGRYVYLDVFPARGVQRLAYRLSLATHR